MSKINIHYKEDQEEIKALTIEGRSAKEVKYRLYKEKEMIFDLVGQGNTILWNELLEDRKILTEEELQKPLLSESELVFSDGSSILLESELFRMEPESATIYQVPGLYPVATEYLLTDSRGIRIDRWRMSEEEFVHTIQNRTTGDGNKRFCKGEIFYLEELVKFCDGTYWTTDKIRIQIGGNDQGSDIEMVNRETEVQIRKMDFVSGEELPGAKLTLVDEAGKIIEQWISGEQPHVIRGILVAGERYTLIEEAAPEGYLIAEQVTFTVSENGTIDKVVMEDKRKEKEEEEPTKPKQPKDDDESDKPKEVPTTEEKEEIPEKRLGYIWAVYKPDVSSFGTVKLLQPTGLKSISMPKTGEESNLNYMIGGMLVSLLGLIWLYIERRKSEFKNTR